MDSAISNEQQSATPPLRRAGALRTTLHCCVLAEGRYLAHAQPSGLVRALRAAGSHVTVTDPAESLLAVGDTRWLEGVDLVVARGRSTNLLTWLAAAEALCVPTINTARAIAAVVDKAHMAVRLRAAGVPTPRTWIGTVEQLHAVLPDTAFPIVLKPVFGDNCRGIEIVPARDQLAAAALSEGCVIAQEFLPGDGFDIKLYAIGQRVWAVRKRSPLHAGTASPPATLLPLPAAWQELALRCGAVFGLQLFGVDCVEHAGALQVIEVNDFPNYSGVPEADLLLARHVENVNRTSGGILS